MFYLELASPIFFARCQASLLARFRVRILRARSKARLCTAAVAAVASPAAAYRAISSDLKEFLIGPKRDLDATGAMQREKRPLV